MKLLIIDTETNKINDPKIIEISVALYQVSDNILETGIINQISTLIPFEGEKEIADINDITSELAQFSLTYQEKVIDLIKIIAKDSDYAIAFNAEFDAPLVNSLLETNLNWICAMKDINWGYYKENFKLTDLALWLGIGVSFVHRAGDDVRLLCECFNRRKEMLPEMITNAIEYANSPLVEVIAKVSFEDKDKAKSAGFFWDANRKIWFKKLRQIEAEKLIPSLNFDATISDNSHYL